MIKLKYRPEIDTLRALAVSAVIIYHAKMGIKNQKKLTASCHCGSLETISIFEWVLEPLKCR